jgi:hypothetical protein
VPIEYHDILPTTFDAGGPGTCGGGFVQKSRPTQNKRARERARQERQQQKAARRLEAKARKASTPGTRDGEDPDIAGIVPGPQPSPWGDDEGDVEEVESERES